ncbi:MAG: hypothetical protein ACOYOK_07340 [Pseudobdellovibrionaceae bacterium]
MIKNPKPIQKSITEIREANRGVDQKKLENDIAKSIKAVRKQARKKPILDN